jgi:hypothetical protein
MSAVEVIPKEKPRRAAKPGTAISATLTPPQLLALAVQQGADLDRLQKLLDLKNQWEATEARKAFVVAMSAFKADPVKILKSKRADIPGGAKYNYATLADVYDGALAAMSRHGLSHRFEVKQEGGLITVTCIVTHELGHSERVALSAPPDDSGKKNAVQQIASTVHYLERYTFLAATGLASSEVDDDARGSRPPAPQEQPPPDYERWRADMVALADMGLEELTKAWGNKSEHAAEYRRYVIKFDEPWWLELKAKARKVSEAAAARVRP